MRMDTHHQTAQPYYEDEGVQLYEGDCYELLEGLDIGSSARPLVLMDPPYVFGLASTAKEGKAGGWGDMMNSARLYAAVLELCRRLVGRGGAAWVFNSWRSFPVLAKASHLARWPIESLLVWDKDWIGPGGCRGLRPSYELCALFLGEGFGLRNRGLADLWKSPWSSRKPTGHPAEKPVALLRRIIEASEADLVIDPFSGSGSTLVAARSLGVPAIGIEVSERWCERSAARLASLPLHDRESGQRALFDSSQGELGLPVDASALLEAV